MISEPFWQPLQSDDRSTRQIERMTGALIWLRQAENSFVVFADGARANRYVQFATDGYGSEEAAAAIAVPVAVPVLVAAAAGGCADHAGTVLSVAAGAPSWAEPGGYFGEPDHGRLLMEVGSGLWPRSSPRGLADDATVVAKLAALGLHLGGGRHTCRNFCRDGVTEPSDILGALSEEIMVEILHARPTYQLAIKRGHF